MNIIIHSKTGSTPAYAASGLTREDEEGNRTVVIVIFPSYEEAIKMGTSLLYSHTDVNVRRIDA